MKQGLALSWLLQTLEHPLLRQSFALWVFLCVAIVDEWVCVCACLRERERECVCVRERERECVYVWCIHVCRFTLQHTHPTLTVTYPCCRYSYLRKAVRHYPELRDMLAQCSKCAVCGEAFLNTWLECVHFLDAKVSWVQLSSRYGSWYLCAHESLCVYNI